jgi:hypothetical protein
LRKLGVTDVLGVDGGWVDPAALKIPIDQFTPFDLRNKFVMDRTFDLAISVETAEHLPIPHPITRTQTQNPSPPQGR